MKTNLFLSKAVRLIAILLACSFWAMCFCFRTEIGLGKNAFATLVVVGVNILISFGLFLVKEVLDCEIEELEDEIKSQSKVKDEQVL